MNTIELGSLAAWIGIVLSLATLAWSAWRYVAIRKREEVSARFDRLFKLLDLIGGDKETSAYSKTGAIFELRNYPEYSEVIVRICEGSKKVEFSGPLAFMMENEFQHTIDHFEAKK